MDKSKETVMQKIKAVAFDLDGTLVNSAQELTVAIDQMLVALGYEKAGVEKVSIWVGNGVLNLVETALKNADSAQGMDHFDHALTLFNQFYRATLDSSEPELYPGVLETLVTLKQEEFQLALVTNKPSQFLPALLEKMGVISLFDLVLGADDVSVRKPHPAPIFKVLSHFGLYQDELLFVGDSCNDIESGKSAGVRTVGLTYGYNFGRPITAENPTFVIDNMLALLPIARQ